MYSNPPAGGNYRTYFPNFLGGTKVLNNSNFQTGFMKNDMKFNILIISILSEAYFNIIHPVT